MGDVLLSKLPTFNNPLSSPFQGAHIKPASLGYLKTAKLFLLTSFAVSQLTGYCIEPSAAGVKTYADYITVFAAFSSKLPSIRTFSVQC